MIYPLEAGQGLDPWDDAQMIAGRLAQPGAELLVVLGAEAWCQRCKGMRPGFEALRAAHAPAHAVWLWLDLEDHAEFLGDFLPEDLPMLLRWQAGVCVQAAVLESINLATTPAVRSREVELPAAPPEIWAALTQKGWAGS